MNAKDVMTADVITVDPDRSVADIARVLVENHISAVPVVDGKGRILGVVGEGDLLRRMDDESEDHPE